MYVFGLWRVHWVYVGGGVPLDMRWGLGLGVRRCFVTF